MTFHNRAEAGEKLAAALAPLKGRDCVVYALPRGGVPVAAAIAASLQAPLDVILVRKIGVPQHPEIAMGAVVDGGSPTTIVNNAIMKAMGASEIDFNKICSRELREIERRRDIYLGDRPPINPHGRTAIIVDDGIATGATIKAAIAAVRARGPKRLVLAVPVAAPDAIAELSSLTDQLVCLEKPERFTAVGAYYDDFTQVTDAQVVDILRSARNQPRPSL